MFIAITTISIFAITGLIWLANRIQPPFKICPICAGVSGTWLWMLAGKFLGYEVDLVMLALLMGGSVVGIAYQIEKRLPSNRSPLLWKTLFIPTGFIAVYSVISSWWLVFIVLAAFLIVLALVFTEQEKSNKATATTQNPKVEELEKKMKNCC